MINLESVFISLSRNKFKYYQEYLHGLAQSNNVKWKLLVLN